MTQNFTDQTSKESNKKQLELSRKQGDAFLAAVKEMVGEEADSGKLKEVDDYLIGYAVEHAEGMYEWQDGELVWHNPTDENAHIEIVVADKADGRFLPGLEVRVTLLDADGQEVGTHTQPFLWHPWLYHYGRNWKVPGSGTYSLRVDVQPPPYMRHDKVHGKRHQRSANVAFENVKIEAGQKLN